MRYSVAYDKALEISKNMEDSLLQRLNFFLVGTAFLIAGLATLMAGDTVTGLNPGQLRLAYIINALGLYLSLFFTVINFLNIEFLLCFGKYIRDLEKRVKERKDKLHITQLPPAAKAEAILQSKIEGFPWRLLRRLFRQLHLLVSDIGEGAKGGKVHHTFVVPVIFVGVWLAIFFGVLPPCWIAVLVVFGLIGLLFAAMRYLPGILTRLGIRGKTDST